MAKTWIECVEEYRTVKSDLGFMDYLMLRLCARQLDDAGEVVPEGHMEQVMAKLLYGGEEREA